ncbi:Sialic acid-binding Ig-like lectin 13 [Labeo rohita]|uniref:Sialic acid-binding Ig-like lectin 13 n=1 Tax=Labeo rohita TaxID=84645 RepID=A0ABQ8MR84_LABRO|nr:Sialic acid-binding Ig-like lectin 13 [Labeo rohita]
MDTAEKIIFFCFLIKGVCCRDFSISLPEKIEALSGSCVIINCTFEIKETYDKDLTETATGVWFKDGTDLNKNQVFNSSTSGQNSFIKGNITGKLKDKNCTTVFYDLRSNHSGKYYFRIEGENGLKWTYAKTSVSIHVIGELSPKPRVQLYVEQKEVQDQEEVLEVLEGSSVSLRCSAETLCSSPPPTLTWSSTPRIPLSESSRLQELISDLNFTATHRQHRVTFTCTITYQLQDKNKTAQNNITLHMHLKSLHSSSCVRTDVTVCFCEADGNPFPELEWHLSGRPVTNSSNTLISEERLSSTGLRSSITLHQFESFLCADWSCCCGSGGRVVVRRYIYHCTVISQENQDDPVYVMMSSAEAATANQESIVYSSIDFTNSKPQEVVSISSLHAVYSIVQDCSGGLAKTKGSIGESSRTREAQVIVSADVLTKQTQSKQSKELFKPFLSWCRSLSHPAVTESESLQILLAHIAYPNGLKHVTFDRKRLN